MTRAQKDRVVKAFMKGDSIAYLSFVSKTQCAAHLEEVEVEDLIRTEMGKWHYNAKGQLARRKRKR